MTAYTVRTARPRDTGRILDHALAVHASDEAAFVTGADEFPLTAEQLRRTLERFAKSSNSLFLLAEADGQVIATLSAEGGRFKKVRHNAHLGLSVRRRWRRQGVATALMRRAEEAAIEGGIVRRFTLTVFASNTPAIALYESLGYVVEGRRKEAVLSEDGYVDELLMARALSGP